MLFVKMVQILDVQKDPVWSFLQAVKKSGSPLTRPTLVTRCAKDLAVVQTVSEIAQVAAVSSQTASSTPITFFGILMVETIHSMDRAPENLVTTLMPAISKGLHKNARAEFQTAAYMVCHPSIENLLLKTKDSNMTIPLVVIESAFQQECRE